MSMSLASALKQYAAESGLIPHEDDQDHSHIGAEEITVVTDETKTELDEAVQDMADQVDKLEASEAGAEKLIEATDSLEAYVTTLRDMRASGQALTGASARLFLMGVADSLESRSIPAGVFEGDVMSMNHSFESADTDHSFEAEEKTEGLLRRLWNMLKAAANAVWTAIKEFFTTMGKSAGAIEASGKKLQRISGSLGSLKSEKKIPGKPYAALVINGNVEAAQAIGEVANKHLEDFNRTLLTPMVKLQGDLAGKMKSATGPQLMEAIKTLSESAPGDFSMALPGGSKLEYKVLEGGVKNLWKTGKLIISKPAAFDKEADPLSPAGVKTVGDALVTVAKRMRNANANATTMIEQSKAILTAAEGLMKKSEGGTPEEKKAAAEVLKAAQSAIKAVGTVTPKYVAYMGGVAKNAYSFAMASAGRYGKGGAAGKEDGKAAAGEAEDGKK